MFRNPIQSYHTNAEYRQALRDFFKMNTDPDTILKDIDEESYDELLYDTHAVKIGLEKIYQDTLCHIEFTNLYKKAASAMLSEDLETGLAICFCYDYFYKFSYFLSEFYGDFENWKLKGLENPLYKELNNIL
jgi:hypothetical protein